MKEELIQKANEARIKIADIILKFQEETGLMISNISVEAINASSVHGAHWLPGTITIDYKL